MVVGHELPAHPSGSWCPATVAWWETWKSSPQGAEFTSTDWDFLVDTALIHDAVWGGGDLDRLAELRIRTGKLGATVEDRRRLKVDGPSPAPERTPLDELGARRKGSRTVGRAGSAR